MPSMKWIREQANSFLNCVYPYGAKDRLSFAKYERQAAIVSELIFWMEAQEKLDKMAKKQNTAKGK